MDGFTKPLFLGRLSHERLTRPQGYKTFFMLSSAETKIYPAHKCKNANNCWHFNIYEQDKLLVFEFRT